MIEVLNWAGDHPVLAVLLAMIVFGNLSNAVVGIFRLFR